MGTKAINERSYESFVGTWGAGAVGGLIGGIAMGVILHAGANMMPSIGALYGWPTVVGGWIGHLVNSVLLGLIFALIVSRWDIDDRTASITDWAFYGTLYAAAVGLVTGGVMIPITVNLLGSGVLPMSELPIAGLAGGLLVAFSVGVAHLVYGVILGTLYSRIHGMSLVERDPADRDTDTLYQNK